MSRINAEIKRAAAEAAVDVKELTDSECQHIRQALLQKYTSGLTDWPLWIWEHVQDEYATQCPDGWRAIGDFAADSDVVLFFNPKDDQSIFLFHSGRDVVRVLGECSGFEVYFTDLGTSFLLIYNHHDYLVACGTAKEWAKHWSTRSSESNEDIHD
jgi:hypothetical protein